jgi:hypothetical protein
MSCLSKSLASHALPPDRQTYVWACERVFASLVFFQPYSNSCIVCERGLHLLFSATKLFVKEFASVMFLQLILNLCIVCERVYILCAQRETVSERVCISCSSSWYSNSCIVCEGVCIFCSQIQTVWERVCISNVLAADTCVLFVKEFTSYVLREKLFLKEFASCALPADAQTYVLFV